MCGARGGEYFISEPRWSSGKIVPGDPSSGLKGSIHCKKELAVFPSPAGMSLIKLFLGGNNLVFSRPERVWSVTSRLGTGKWLTLFYSVLYLEIVDFFIFVEQRSCDGRGARSAPLGVAMSPKRRVRAAHGRARAAKTH
jgi:hypothetical protein